MDAGTRERRRLKCLRCFDRVSGLCRRKLNAHRSRRQGYWRNAADRLRGLR